MNSNDLYIVIVIDIVINCYSVDINQNHQCVRFLLLVFTPTEFFKEGNKKRFVHTIGCICAQVSLNDL